MSYTGPCRPTYINQNQCWHCQGYSGDPTVTINYPATWIGMMLSTDDDINGCTRGCKSCYQRLLASNRQSAVRMDGTRWMKAYQPLRDEYGVPFDEEHEPEQPNRLANGMTGDLLSYNAGVNLSIYTDIERARRIPKNVSFLRGVCWWNDASTPFTDAPTREGFRHLPVVRDEPFNRFTPFEWDACDCDVEESTVPDEDSANCGSVPSMHPVPGWFRDEFFYEFTNFSDPYWCRQGAQRVSEVVRSNVGAMMNPNIWNPTSCGINFMSQCVGIAADGEYNCDEYDTEQRIDHRYQDWNQLGLDFRNARIGYDVDNVSRSPNLRAVDEATVDMKNRLLAELRFLPNPIEGGVGQTFAHVDFLGADNGTSVATWRRLYDPIPEGTAPSLPFRLLNCRLRQTQAAVTIEPYIIKGQVDIDIQMIHVDMTPAGIATRATAQNINPHVRFHTTAQVGYKATAGWDETDPPRMRNSFLPANDPGFVAGYTELELLNYDDEGYPAEQPRPNMPPIVRKVGETADWAKQPDEIVYVDDQGRQFLPPTRIDWWGYMGVYSAIPTHNVWRANASPGILYQQPDCAELNELLAGDDHRLKVSGWPYLFQTVRDQDPEAEGNGDNAQVYGGFVTLDFAAHAIPLETGACCDEDTGDCQDGLTAASCANQGLVYLGNDTLCAESPCGPPILVNVHSGWEPLNYATTLIVRDVPQVDPAAIINDLVVITLKVSAPLDLPDGTQQDVAFYSWWRSFTIKGQVFRSTGSLCPGIGVPDIYNHGFAAGAFKTWRNEGLARPEAPAGWSPNDIQFEVQPSGGTPWLCSDPDDPDNWGQPPFFDPRVQVSVRFSYREIGS